jgi:hypothetical protein
MRSYRLGALALVVMLVAAACGGGGGGKAASTSSTSDSSTEDSSSSSKGQSAQARKAAEQFQQARDIAKKAGDALFAQEQKDYAAGDVTVLKADMSKFRDIAFEFDKAVRTIEFPDDVADARNDFLTKSGDLIAAQDDVQKATTVKEFHQLEIDELRVGAVTTEARFALLRALDAPDPTDPGEPKKASERKGDIVLQDAFSDVNSGWATGSGNGGSFGYDNGTYLLTLAAANGVVTSDTALAGAKKDPKLESLDGVSVSATVTKVNKIAGFVGLMCHEQANKGGYVAEIDVTGEWSLGRVDGTKFTDLTNENDKPANGVSSVIESDKNDVRMDCVTKGGSVTVTLIVNGKQIAQGTDKSSPLAPGAVAVRAEGFEVCCNAATFDNFEVVDLG